MCWGLSIGYQIDDWPTENANFIEIRLFRIDHERRLLGLKELLFAFWMNYLCAAPHEINVCFGFEILKHEHTAMGTGVSHCVCHISISINRSKHIAYLHNWFYSRPRWWLWVWVELIQHLEVCIILFNGTGSARMQWAERKMCASTAVLSYEIIMKKGKVNKYGRGSLLGWTEADISGSLIKEKWKTN